MESLPKFEEQQGNGINNDDKSSLKDTYGLSTRVALGRLYEEIEKILLNYEQKYAEER